MELRPKVFNTLVALEDLWSLTDERAAVVWPGIVNEDAVANFAGNVANAGGAVRGRNIGASERL